MFNNALVIKDITHVDLEDTISIRMTKTTYVGQNEDLSCNVAERKVVSFLLGWKMGPWKTHLLETSKPYNI